MTQRLTPATEEHIRSQVGEVTEHVRGLLRPLLAEITALRAELAGVNEILHRERMRLGACGVAARGVPVDVLPEYESDSLRAVRELGAQLAGAEERGAARERAATVAWCGSNTAWGIVGKVGFGHSDVHTAVTRLAECIERGDHVRTGTTPPRTGSHRATYDDARWILDRADKLGSERGNMGPFENDYADALNEWLAGAGTTPPDAGEPTPSADQA